MASSPEQWPQWARLTIIPNWFIRRTTRLPSKLSPASLPPSNLPEEARLFFS